MVGAGEKRIVWDPRGGNKFVVGGGAQLTLYEYTPAPTLVQVASQHDLALMKCFAWSPDDRADDLVAAGTASGRVELLRLRAAARGAAHVPARGPHAVLVPKAGRACTALAFCPAAPQYLAVGYDKVRSDASLVLWDLAAAAPALALPTSTPLSAPPPSPAHVPAPLPGPPLARRLSAARDTRPPPFVLPRHDSLGARADARIAQTHLPAEAVHALAWLPGAPHLLAAALSQRWLRLLDVRAPREPAPALPAPRVSALAGDPCAPHRFAAATDGTVTVWDARRLPAPLLSFSARDAAADGGGPPGYITGLEFSTTRRGLLATLERDAPCVRLWDVLSVRTERGSRDQGVPRAALGGARAGWAAGAASMLPWAAASSGVAPPPQDATPPPESDDAAYELVLTDTRTSKRLRGPLASFALVPPAGPAPATTTTVLATTRDGDLELATLPHGPAHAHWSARGNFALGAGAGLRVFAGISADEEVPAHAWAVPAAPRAPTLESPRGRRGADGAGTSTSVSATFGRGDEHGFPALVSPRRVPSPALPPYIKRESATRSAEPEPASALLAPPPPMLSRGVTGIDSTSSEPQPGADSESRTKDAGGGVSRARSAARARRRAVERVQSLVSDDASMVARTRALAGYGLSNPAHNATLFAARDEPEPDLEDPDAAGLRSAWLFAAQARALPALVHGYDFRAAGVLALWEGFAPTHATPAPAAALPAHLDAGAEAATGRARSKRGRTRGADTLPAEYTAALLARSPALGEEPGWRPPSTTSRLIARRAALSALGWAAGADDTAAALARWEARGAHARVAAWLVFAGKPDRAADVLLRSEREAERAMAGTVAALAAAATHGALPPALQQHCERLSERLGDPYFGAMLRFLALGEWGDVLDEDALPLRERLAAALQFLDDGALTRFLRRAAERAGARGDPAGLLLVGAGGARGTALLQAYVDRTGDVQSAALLASHVGADDARVRRWVDAYADLLDGWRLFHHRVQLDVERGARRAEGGTARAPARQVLLRCNFCNRIMSPPPAVHATGRDTACPHCGRPLPRCAVCLMYLSLIADSTRDGGHTTAAAAAAKDTVDDAIVFCQTCRHGGHAAHIMEWFYGDGEEGGTRSHGVCPVADCTHRCADEM